MSSPLSSPFALHSTPDWLSLVRERCAHVAQAAHDVQINEHRLVTFASALPVRTAGSQSLDWRYHFRGTPEQMVSFFVALDTINFGSGYFPFLEKLPGLSGYCTIATHLTHFCYHQGVPDARWLRSVAPQQCAALFHQTADDGPIWELMTFFAHAWNQLGELLEECYEGNPALLIAASEQKAQRLIALLFQLPFYRDIALYHGLEIPFLKRAQLLAADLSLALADHPLGVFSDIDQLTIFADNLVPHVLRCEGILEYSQSLATLIDHGGLLPAGSTQEIEIRAAAVHAVERISFLLRKRGIELTSHQLDHFLWTQGQSPYFKSRPRHRTRSVFY